MAISSSQTSPVIHPIYAERAQQIQQSAYNIALSDWFHAPIIHEVTRQDSHIRVNATDNVQVAKVLITIVDQQKQTIEQDEAARLDDAWWEFETAASTEGKVIVEAFDLAGNCTKREA